MRKKIFFFIIFFLTPFLVGFFFIKTIIPKSDQGQYYFLSYNLAKYNVLSSDDNEKILKPEIIRTPAHAFLTYFFISKKDLEINENEKKYNSNILIKITYFNYICFILFCIFSYLLSRYFISKKMSAVLYLIVSLNPFFLSRIPLIDIEILASLVLVFCTYCLFIYYKKKKIIYFIFFSIFMSYLILLKNIFIFLPIFLIIFQIYKNFVPLKAMLIFLIIVYLPLSTWIIRNNIIAEENKIIFSKISKNKSYIINNNSDLLNNNINSLEYLDNNAKKHIIPVAGTSSFRLRALYSTIEWREIPALAVSFFPKNISNQILNKYFSKSDYNKFAPRIFGRSFFYRNNYLLFDNQIKRFGIDHGISDNLKSIKLISNNLPKYIATYPFFLLRFSNTNVGSTDIKRIFNINKINYLIVYLIFYKLLFLIINFFLLFIFFYYFLKKNTSMVIFSLLSIYCLLFYTLFTHAIPRYSAILFPINLSVFLYFINEKFFKKK